MSDLERVIKMLQRSLTDKVVGQCNTRSKKMARAIEKATKALQEIQDSTDAGPRLQRAALGQTRLGFQFDG